MMDKIDILDVVALTEDLPERGLYKGQVGTVVESLAPGVFEIEFSDEEGRAKPRSPWKSGNSSCFTTSL